MRPKSEIYTPKRDDEHPRLFHMGVPPREQTHTPGTSPIKKMRGPFSDKWHLPFCRYWYFFGTENGNGLELCHLQNTGKFFAFSRLDAWHW